MNTLIRPSKLPRLIGTDYAETVTDENWESFNADGFFASDKDLTDVVKTNVSKIYYLEHPHKKRNLDLLDWHSRILMDNFSSMSNDDVFEFEFGSITQIDIVYSSDNFRKFDLVN